MNVLSREPATTGPNVLPISLIEELVSVIVAILFLEEFARSRAILMTFVPEMKKRITTKIAVSSGTGKLPPISTERARIEAAERTEVLSITLL